MKLANKDNSKIYTAIQVKGGEMPKWTEKTEAKKIKVGENDVELYANQEKSNYIYFRMDGKVFCIYATKEGDVNGFDILGETSVAVYVKPVQEKPVKVKAEKAPKAAKEAKAPKVNKAAAGADSVAPKVNKAVPDTGAA